MLDSLKITGRVSNESLLCAMLGAQHLGTIGGRVLKVLLCSIRYQHVEKLGSFLLLLDSMS